MMTGAKKRKESAAGEIVVVGMGNCLQWKLSTVGNYLQWEWETIYDSATQFSGWETHFGKLSTLQGQLWKHITGGTKEYKSNKC